MKKKMKTIFFVFPEKITYTISEIKKRFHLRTIFYLTQPSNFLFPKNEFFYVPWIWTSITGPNQWFGFRLLPITCADEAVPKKSLI